MGDDVRELLDARFIPVDTDDVMTQFRERYRHGGAEPTQTDHAELLSLQQISPRLANEELPLRMPHPRQLTPPRNRDRERQRADAAHEHHRDDKCFAAACK